MLTGFDHVTLAVRDRDAALESYRKLLGVEPSWRGGHPELGLQAALFSLDNASIELMAPAPHGDEAEGLRMALAAQGERITTLCFRCEDADALARTLRERGLRATAPQEGEAEGEDGTKRSYRLVELSPRSTRGVSLSFVERPAGSLPTLRATRPDQLHALDHVVIRSADLDAAIRLYRDGLGIRLALDTQFGGLRMLFFRIGGVTLEVVQDPRGEDQDVLHGLAYRAGDLAAARARLKAEGLSVGEPRPGNKVGTHVFSVRDGTASVPTLVLMDPARPRS